MKNKNEIYKTFRKDYKLEHGHYPENYHAKIGCKVCQDETDKTWSIISGQAKLAAIKRKN
jgi:hypothetical protein